MAYFLCAWSACGQREGALGSQPHVPAVARASLGRPHQLPPERECTGCPAFGGAETLGLGLFLVLRERRCHDLFDLYFRE